MSGLDGLGWPTEPIKDEIMTPEKIDAVVFQIIKAFQDEGKRRILKEIKAILPELDSEQIKESIERLSK